MKNIAIIFGGKSCEHDISIITACSLMQNLNENEYKIYPLYIKKDGKILYNKKFSDIAYFKQSKTTGKSVSFVLGKNYIKIKSGVCYKKVKIDFCFNSTHGLNGEDGSLSGLLNLCQIPYSCSDILASSISMDKVATKYVCVANKIPVVEYVQISKQNYKAINLNTIISNIGFPCIVKPARLGSSIGITRCENMQDLESAIELAFCLDNSILIEKALVNFKEYNIAVLKDDNQILLSKIEQPLGKDTILSFEDKYLANSKTKGMESLDRIIPAKINKTLENKIKNYAKNIYKSLSFSGVIRIDFLYAENKLYLNEINSIPGSFANYLWNFNYSQMLHKIINNSLKEFNEKQNLTYTFSSSVLKEGNGKK